MILLVSYDLNAPGKDYEKLYKELKSASSWWHYLDSTWLLYTSKHVETWSDKIRKVVDANDHFIIVDITKRSRNGWMPEKAWEWIRKYENL